MRRGAGQVRAMTWPGAIRLCWPSGGDVVVVDEAAEDRAAPDLRGGGGSGRGSGEGHRRHLIPALVRPPVVVVGRVFRQDGAQVRLVDDEEVVQALRAEGADDALRD